VVLSDEDLRRANPESTQTIDILAFVDAEQVPLIYYEQPYYLAPGKGGDKVYALLRDTLREVGKIGIATSSSASSSTWRRWCAWATRSS
jgi:DNA end-binding protein Ku